MFAGGERGGKYANINPRDLAHTVRSRAKGTYRAAGISLATRQISQIREDLYRFSLSASSDKLNFPRALFSGTYQPDKLYPYHTHNL